MKFVCYCSVVLTATFLAGCQQETANVAAPPAPEAPAVASEPEVAAASEAPKEFVIDVRSQEEWDAGHLSQAVLIPHTEISDRIAEVTEDKSAKIVLH